jgi:hypothetical protein
VEISPLIKSSVQSNPSLLEKAITTITMPWVYVYAGVGTSIFLMDPYNPRYLFSYFLEIYGWDSKVRSFAFVLFVLHEYIMNVILLQTCALYALIVFGHIYIVSKLISLNR